MVSEHDIVKYIYERQSDIVMARYRSILVASPKPRPSSVRGSSRGALSLRMKHGTTGALLELSPAMCRLVLDLLLFIVKAKL